MGEAERQARAGPEREPVLVVGPWGEDAVTFSRFVLPLRYQPVPLDGPVDLATPAYHHRQVTDRGRLGYLTSDTASVLFRRTAWFELAPQTPGLQHPVSVPGYDGRSFQVAFQPPRLVLFEWRREDAPARDGLLPQVGFLLLDAFFPDRQRAPTPRDLLRFNELFRYWHCPFAGHSKEKQYHQVLGNCPVDAGSDGSTVAQADDGAAYTGRWESLLRFPLVSGGKRFRLFPEEWTQRVQQWIESPVDTDPDHWAAYSDSRAFVWTAAVLHDGCNALERTAPGGCHGWWVKLLNVDHPDRDSSWEQVAGSTAFERRWAAARTYHRWRELGSLYGFTFHSGASVLPPSGAPALVRHFREQYFDQVLLLLYLRVASFLFSDELSRLSGQPEGFEGKFRKLRWRFVLFTNLYRFPLLSNQQQGVELYACARKAMDVDELFAEVQTEIAATHQYLDMKDARSQTSVTVLLTLVATVGLLLSVVSGIFGMNVILNRFTVPWPAWGIVLGDAGAVLVVLGLLVVAFRWLMRNTDRVGNWLGVSQQLEKLEKQTPTGEADEP